MKRLGELLELYIEDNAAGWLLQADGHYKPPGPHTPASSAQEQLMQSKP